MNLRNLLPGCLALALLCPALPARAQEGLRSPAAFLGYEPGSRFTPHHRVVAYFEHVAAQAPAVRLERYGETYEGRPLLLAIVSSPENMARLEAIRTDNLRRAGLLGAAAEAGSAPAADGPALVWLSYNVHGNESVSTEAAMATLYDLADPGNAQTQAWLRDAVVLIDPCINPDGRDRYVAWYNRTVGRFPNAAPDAREHHEPWPGGRTNHYYFDLNRDWAWATQVETQQRLARYHQWMPHVHVDFHEQGVDEPYFFAPAAEPFHERITPWQRELQTMIGRNHTRYFDARGWLYFTRQVFDLLYPGYGDTWPTFNGAVGMTYEQAGSGRAGLGIVTAEGDTLRLRDRIAHHHTTGLSTLETASENHRRIVEEFARYFEQARTAPQGAYKTYVVKGGNADKRAALAALLDRQGVAYGFATRTLRTRGLAYADGRTAAVQIEPGDLLVSAYQPRSVLADVLFDPNPALSDTLTYDITAWALPYVYGLEAYALPERLDPGPPTLPPAASANAAGLDRPYAYLAEWQSFEDLQWLAAVLRAGVKLRFAREAFEIDGRRFEAGTLILTRKGNEALGERFDRLVHETAAALGQPVYPVATGYVTAGADFGSADVPFLKKPRVAVLAGPRLSAYASGEVWHFFDQQLAYPVTLLDADDFGDVRLDDYDVLVLPSGAYADVLTDERLAALKEWIGAGGRLVALERAAAFLAGKEGFALQRKEQEDDEKKDQQDEAKDPERLLRTYARRQREAISDDVPGAVFRVRLDATHPLAFGYGDAYFTLKRNDDAFAFLEKGWNVGVLRQDARASGFVGAKAGKKLDDTLVFGVQEMGRGAVVYLLDDPLFRGFWYNGRLLFGNAVFLVGQ